MRRTEMFVEFVARTALLSFFLLSAASTRCTNYGSDTAPSREAFASIVSSPNTIMSFAGMYNGFALSAIYTTAVTFNSRFPVGAIISLNGGTLTLSQALLLDSNLVFGSPGTITGNNYAVEFEPQNQVIRLPWSGTINQLASQNPGLYLAAVGWSPDGKYAAAGPFSHNQTMNVYSFNGLSLTLSVSSYTGVNNNALAWQPGLPPSYYFVVGGYGGTNGLFAYQFIPMSSLQLTSSVNTGTDYNAVTWHPVGNIVAASQTSMNSQQIQLFNFSAGALTPNTSYSFTDTTQVVAYRALTFDYSGNYLAAGCNNANQLQIFRWNGTSLVSTASANTGQAVVALSWSPDGSLIAVGVTDGLQIYRFDRKASTLTLLPSYYVSYSGSALESIDWSPDGRTIAVGSAYSGIPELQVFAVNSTAQKLLGVGQYIIATTFYSVKWSPNGNYLLTGDTNGIVRVFNFTGSLNLQNTKLVFNSPAQLRSALACTGACIIDCNGYTLDLNSQIVTVAAGSSLLVHNAVLEGFTGTNLQCIDSLGTVSFDNVACIVNKTMQWSQGSLAIVRDCTMTGSGTFIYSSSQTSTIYPFAQWYFDRGMTFSYYPQSGLNSLINFADSTAQLYLYETALYAQPAGLQFTKGTVAVEGRCPFYSAAAVAANGILFGDNLTSTNNANLMILPESGIDCRSGYVVDQNIGG